MRQIPGIAAVTAKEAFGTAGGMLAKGLVLALSVRVAEIAVNGAALGLQSLWAWVSSSDEDEEATKPKRIGKTSRRKTSHQEAAA